MSQISKTTKLYDDINNNIESIENALIVVNQSLNEIQDAGEIPYWNGSNACEQITTLLKSISVCDDLLKQLKAFNTKMSYKIIEK